MLWRDHSRLTTNNLHLTAEATTQYTLHTSHRCVIDMLRMIHDRETSSVLHENTSRYENVMLWFFFGQGPHSIRMCGTLLGYKITMCSRGSTDIRTVGPHAFLLRYSAIDVCGRELRKCGGGIRTIRTCKGWGWPLQIDQCLVQVTFNCEHHFSVQCKTQIHEENIQWLCSGSSATIFTWPSSTCDMWIACERANDKLMCSNKSVAAASERPEIGWCEASTQHRFPKMLRKNIEFSFEIMKHYINRDSSSSAATSIKRKCVSKMRLCYSLLDSASAQCGERFITSFSKCRIFYFPLNSKNDCARESIIKIFLFF